MKQFADLLEKHKVVAINIWRNQKSVQFNAKTEENTQGWSSTTAPTLAEAMAEYFTDERLKYRAALQEEDAFA